MSPEAMLLQRDRALACMVLVLGLCLSVFLTVFGAGDAPAIAAARSQVEAHEDLLRNASQVLQDNRQALAAVRSSLEKTRRQ